MAKLYFRYGAMNSGKSTALLQAAFNYEERGHRVLLAKPAVDTKGDRSIVSRLGVVREVDFTIEPDADVLDRFQHQRTQVIEEHGRDVSCLLIDEGQFLSSDQVDDLLRIALMDDIPVIAYGIRTDFQTVAFPGSRRLLEIAHSLEELKTICRCGRKAIFNARRIDGRFVFDGDQVAIDGVDVTTNRSAASATSRRAAAS
jgi:thymidine kinase